MAKTRQEKPRKMTKRSMLTVHEKLDKEGCVGEQYKLHNKTEI